MSSLPTPELAVRGVIVLFEDERGVEAVLDTSIADNVEGAEAGRGHASEPSL